MNDEKKDGVVAVEDVIKLEWRVSQLVRLYKTLNEASIVSSLGLSQLKRYKAMGTSEPAFRAVSLMALDKGVSLEWLATGEGEMMLSTKTPSKEMLYKKLYNECKKQPKKISLDSSESLTQLMISEGLLQQEWEVAIKYFVNTYNQVCSTSGSNKDMKKAIIKYMISFQEEQLAAFRIQLEAGDVPDPVKAFEDVLKKGIEEKQQKLESLK